MAFIQLELPRFLVDPRYQFDKAQTTTQRGLRALKLCRACSHYFLSLGYRADCGGTHGTHVIKSK